MKKLITLGSFILLFATSTAGQSGDYKKWEFFGGYSSLYFDNLAGDTSNPDVNDVLGGRQNLRG